MAGAWKSQLDHTCLSCIAEGQVSNPSPVKQPGRFQQSSWIGPRATSARAEPFAVCLHVPPGSARGRERGGLRLCKPFGRSSACFVSALNNLGQHVPYVVALCPLRDLLGRLGGQRLVDF